MTLVLVTHDTKVARRAPRTAVITKGKLAMRDNRAPRVATKPGPRRGPGPAPAERGGPAGLIAGRSRTIGRADSRTPDRGGRPVDLEIDAGRALSHLRASDAELGRLIDGVGPFALQLPGGRQHVQALAEAIVYQQLAPRAAATIFQRFCALFPGAPRCPTPEHVVGVPEALRAAGLSGAKELAVRDLAQRSVDGEVPTLVEAREMDDEAIVERLVRVRGIGRWTAEMFLIFTLGRPDVLPADDYGLRRGFQLAFETATMPTRQEVAERGARWAPYRTVASWYLWRAREAVP